MTRVQGKSNVAFKSYLNRLGAGGAALGLVGLLACELPIILAALGMAGLSAHAMSFRPPPAVEAAAIILLVVSAVILGAAFLWRIKNERGAEDS